MNDKLNNSFLQKEMNNNDLNKIDDEEILLNKLSIINENDKIVDVNSVDNSKINYNSDTEEFDSQIPTFKNVWTQDTIIKSPPKINNLPPGFDQNNINMSFNINNTIQKDKPVKFIDKIDILEKSLNILNNNYSINQRIYNIEKFTGLVNDFNSNNITKVNNLYHDVFILLDKLNIIENALGSSNLNKNINDRISLIEQQTGLITPFNVNNIVKVDDLYNNLISL